jgi:hypothetical protein
MLAVSAFFNITLLHIVIMINIDGFSVLRNQIYFHGIQCFMSTLNFGFLEKRLLGYDRVFICQ